MIALVTTAMGAYAIFKKKLTAQAFCVKSAVTLQRELGRDLTELLRFNPEARRLRRARAKADAAVKKALASKIPKVIAAAKAVQTAVILQQVALRARQDAILARSTMNRGRAKRSLQLNLKSLGVATVRGNSFYIRPLAVEPKPANSLTPDFQPVADFENFQQQEYSFALRLSPDFLKLDVQQKTLCSATLKNQEGKWREKIVAASLLSKRP